MYSGSKMINGNHRWDISDKKKKLVNKNYMKFLEPNAINIVHRLATCLSERERDHIEKLDKSHSNEDVMRQLLDYLVKRPNWWISFERALADGGYTEHAEILRGRERPVSRQQPGEMPQVSRPSANDHFQPIADQSRQQAHQLPHHDNAQRLPDHYAEHYYYYYDMPQLFNQPSISRDNITQPIVQLPESVMFVPTPPPYQNTNPSRPNQHMSPTPPPYQNIFPTTPPPPYHSLSPTKKPRNRDSYSVSEDSQILAQSILQNQQRLFEQHHQQHERHLQQQHLFQAQQNISQNGHLAPVMPASMLQTIKSDQDEKMVNVSSPSDYLKEGHEDDAVPCNHDSEILHGDVEFCQKSLIKEKQQVTEREQFSTKTFNNVDFQHLPRKSLPASNNFSNRKSASLKENVNGASKLSLVSENDSSVEVEKTLRENSDISFPSSLHSLPTATGSSDSSKSRIHKDNYFNEKDCGNSINMAKLPTTILSNGSTIKQMGEVLNTESVTQDISTNIRYADQMHSDENNAAVPVGESDVKQNQCSAIGTVKTIEEKHLPESYKEEKSELPSQSNLMTTKSIISKDSGGVWLNELLDTKAVYVTAPSSSIYYPPSIPRSDVMATHGSGQSFEPVASNFIQSTKFSSKSNENNSILPMSSENNTRSKMESKEINVSQDFVIGNAGQTITKSGSVRPTTGNSHTEAERMQPPLPHFSILMSDHSSCKQEENSQASVSMHSECLSVQIGSINTVNKKLETSVDEDNKTVLQSYMQSVDDEQHSISVTSQDFENILYDEATKPRNVGSDTADYPCVDATGEENEMSTPLCSLNQATPTNISQHLNTGLPVSDSNILSLNNDTSISLEASKQQDVLSLPNGNSGLLNKHDYLSSEKILHHDLPVGIAQTDTPRKEDFIGPSPYKEHGNLSAVMETLAVSNELRQPIEQHPLTLTDRNMEKSNIAEFQKLESTREQLDMQEKAETQDPHNHSLGSVDMDSLLFGSNHELFLTSDTEATNQVDYKASDTRERGGDVELVHADEITNTPGHKARQLDHSTGSVSEREHDRHIDMVDAVTESSGKLGTQPYIRSSDTPEYYIDEETDPPPLGGNKEGDNSSDTPGHEGAIQHASSPGHEGAMQHASSSGHEGAMQHASSPGHEGAMQHASSSGHEGAMQHASSSGHEGAMQHASSPGHEGAMQHASSSGHEGAMQHASSSGHEGAMQHASSSGHEGAMQHASSPGHEGAMQHASSSGHEGAMQHASSPGHEGKQEKDRRDMQPDRMDEVTDGELHNVNMDAQLDTEVKETHESVSDGKLHNSKMDAQLDTEVKETHESVSDGELHNVNINAQLDTEVKETHESVSDGKLHNSKMDAQLDTEVKETDVGVSGISRHGNELQCSQVDEAANQSANYNTNSSVFQHEAPSLFRSFWHSPFTKMATYELFTSLR